MDFVKADSRNRREAVLDQLLSFIAGQDGKAGLRLPTELELAGMFGVSRTVIRESMRSLQATGVVRIEQGRGTFVAEHPFAQPFSVWASLNVHRVAELFEVRILLEGETAFRAASHAAATDLDALEAVLSSSAVQAADGDWAGTMESDREFHHLISRMSGLPMLQEMLEVAIPTWMRITARFSSEANKEHRIGLVMDEHRAVLAGLRQGSPAAAREAMQSHLRNSLERRLKQDLSHKELPTQGS